MAQKKNNDYFALALKITSSLLITIAIFITALIVVLHTSYGLPFLQKSIEKLTDAKLETTGFTYNFRKPFTFYFKNLSIQTDAQKTSHIEELNLTLAPLDSFLTASLVLKDVWLKGSTFTENKNPSLPKSLSVKELSLENINMISKDVRLKNADIQLSDWKNSGNWGKWEGNFMFSAQNAELANENFDEVLINGTRAGDDWELWSATLSSNFGEISTSVSLSSNNFIFEQFTITDARIQPVQGKQSKIFFNKVQNWLKSHQLSIERLDLLNINAAMENANIEHLNLTAHNISVEDGKLKWQEEEPTKFTFNAESFNFRQWISSDLLGDISISKQSIDIRSLSSKLMNNGFMTVVGKIFPDAVDFSDFTMNGIDLAVNADEVKFIQKYWQALEKINVENLSIKRADLTIAEPNFPVYVKNFNIRGTKINAQKNDISKDWRGVINFSASTADVNTVHLTNPIVTAKMEQNRWQISSELPFESGQLKLSAHLNTKNSSHPWQLQGQGISIPSNIYQQWFKAKLPLQGEHDLDVDLYGLSITKEALRYSLSGSLNATLYNSKLQPTAHHPLTEELSSLLLQNKMTDQKSTKEPEKPEEAPVSSDFELAKQKLDSVIALRAGKINVEFDRGQIKLNPTPISTEHNQIILQGNWDFVTRQGGFSSK